ncbi:GDSL-type esterase/lipase family protein [Dysgonomonas macrotermitis]|uniref:Lysophospholipase L1 n=1 Tax=Dysgonomonas macrotermitis TaxID=1346286 RepID=A0A1M4TPU6_9BACT|nr:GDSL-type esterase/lipase family protein [Dysgonomonas macrotermitis]SHE46448.1 Lysophospholipase L1 [Dysgonomonas macrotermitis]
MGNKVVFIGDSITEFWEWKDAVFFKSNGYICKGIGGQTTDEMLLRFKRDVLDLNPQIVVISGGINDASEFNAPYDEDETLANLKFMAESAESNGIKVILTSVPYTRVFNWGGKSKEVSARTCELNVKIELYAHQKGYVFADLFAPFLKSDGSMDSQYIPDEIHPSKEGYALMKTVIEEAISSLLTE